MIYTSHVGRMQRDKLPKLKIKYRKIEKIN
jgi:hypothetical protein